MTISASEVKQKGVSIFDDFLDKSDEVIINVRGKEKYVVLNIERYKRFREQELDLAYMQTMQDIESGNYKVQNAKEHIEEIFSEIEDEL